MYIFETLKLHLNCKIFKLNIFNLLQIKAIFARDLIKLHWNLTLFFLYCIRDPKSFTLEISLCPLFRPLPPIGKKIPFRSFWIIRLIPKLYHHFVSMQKLVPRPKTPKFQKIGKKFTRSPKEWGFNISAKFDQFWSLQAAPKQKYVSF